MAISIPFLRNHFASLDDEISCALGALDLQQLSFQAAVMLNIDHRIILNAPNFS